MDRLTGYSGGKVFFKHGKESGIQTYADAPMWEYVESITRLAAYEDIGTIDTLTRLQRDYSDLRNELCLACGKYKEAHLGRCNGCRWGEKEVHNE